MRTWLTIALLSLVFGMSAMAEQFTGFIAAESCAKDHRAKAATHENADCAQKAIKKGDKAVLVTEDGRVFKIVNQDDVLAHVGRKVQIEGEIKGDAITVGQIVEPSDDGS